MSRPQGTVSGISLRGTPVEQPATLLDGRSLLIRISVPDDSYIARRELETVALELVDGDVVLATVNTILRPEQDSEARAIARELASGLESGETEPTASGIEPFADRFS